MNTQYFFIHIVLLVILTVAALVGLVIFGISYFGDTDRAKQKKPKWAIISLVCGLLFFGGLAWFIASSNEPWRHEYTSLHDVKDVTFPDGSKVQMFTCDNTHHNVTSMFGKVVDEKEWQMRRVRWSPLYLGISWSTCQRCTQGDCFFLEHKKGEQPSIELTPEKEAENPK